jgi:hypothetical protein
MTPPLQAHYEKLLVAAAVAAVAAGAAWAWRASPGLRAVQAEPTQPALSGTAYASAALRKPALEAAAWPKPSPQSAGSGWLYEVFTPPVIYYNATARSFAVTPPGAEAPVGAGEFGLKLLAVKFEPYRLQLAGYFGSPDDYLAAFVASGSPETVLARAGRRFEQLGLTLKNFEVKKVVVNHDDPWPVYDVAGLATLQDERTGEQVVLDSRQPRLTDVPLAVFQPTGGGGRPRELHEGDTFVDGGATYRVERIQIEPAEVVVAKVVPGLPVPDRRVLHPAPEAGDKVAGRAAPKSLSAPPHPRGVANNGL